MSSIHWHKLTYHQQQINHQSPATNGSHSFKLTYGGFHKWGYPPIIHFNGNLPYKPCILGYPQFLGNLQLDSWDMIYLCIHICIYIYMYYIYICMYIYIWKPPYHQRVPATRLSRPLTGQITSQEPWRRVGRESDVRVIQFNVKYTYMYMNV